MIVHSMQVNKIAISVSYILPFQTKKILPTFGAGRKVPGEVLATIGHLLLHQLDTLKQISPPLS